MRLVLFFPDLIESGIAKNHTTLNRRITQEGFPRGRMIGRRRAWTPQGVWAWIESRPVDNPAPLKGAAKARAENGGAG